MEILRTHKAICQWEAGKGELPAVGEETESPQSRLQAMADKHPDRKPTSPKNG